MDEGNVKLVPPSESASNDKNIETICPAPESQVRVISSKITSERNDELNSDEREPDHELDSGNSLTSFMHDGEEEEEEFAVVDAEDEDMDVDAVNSVGQGHEVDEEESVGNNQSLGDMPRERQLTQKFLAGQLSFKDLMQVLVCLKNAGPMPSSCRR